jgi:predicted aconitase with swiveling domain
MPFDALAAFIDSLVSGKGVVVSAAAHNQEILGQTLTGCVLCMPAAVGSTSAGPAWDLLASRGMGPAAVLCAGPIDPLTAGGLIVASLWDGSTVPVVDRLGMAFLEAVCTGNWVDVEVEGQVRVSATSGLAPARGNHPNG